MNYWLQISSGRGPEECRWVVAQLVRYLVDTASRQNIHAELIGAAPGKMVGTLSSALISFEAEKACWEFISDWEGSVQWIGTSMFRPEHKRKNWFVDVQLFEPTELKDMHTQDVKVESMRSSGPGGQHANKTETAIRVTHIPTGLCAVSQQERSQHLNKRLALARLGQLLQQHNKQAKTDCAQKRWGQHNALERGNAVHVFSGKKFRLKK